MCHERQPEHSEEPEAVRWQEQSFSIPREFTSPASSGKDLDGELDTELNRKKTKMLQKNLQKRL
jgi:hypothetical protein